MEVDFSFRLRTGASGADRRTEHSAPPEPHRPAELPGWRLITMLGSLWPFLKGLFSRE